MLMILGPEQRSCFSLAATVLVLSALTWHPLSAPLQPTDASTLMTAFAIEIANRVDTAIGDGEVGSATFSRLYRSLTDFSNLCEHLTAAMSKIGLASTLSAVNQATRGSNQLVVNSSRGMRGLMESFYAYQLRHIVGQWLAKDHRPTAELLRLSFSFSVADSSEFLHGFIWQSMLAELGTQQTLREGDVTRLAKSWCCDMCPAGEGCNDECTSHAEGDWYHHCFHGVGHGIMLTAFVGEVGAGGVASAAPAPTSCEPLEPLSLPPSSEALTAAELLCTRLSTQQLAIRKYCFSGLYMTYFEYSNPWAAFGWHSACAHAACPAACVLKCREFGSTLFPGTAACYGKADGTSITPLQAAELDRIILGRNRAGNAFSLDTEARILAAVGPTSQLKLPNVTYCFG